MTLSIAPEWTDNLDLSQESSLNPGFLIGWTMQPLRTKKKVNSSLFTVALIHISPVMSSQGWSCQVKSSPVAVAPYLNKYINAIHEVPPSSVSPSTETPTPSTVTKVLTSTSPTPEGAPGGSNVTSTSAQEADLAVTVVPIVIVCALIGLGGLGAWLFRRRLFKYRMKTTTKDDLRKQSGSGGTILEDSMALQHWRGPRAHSNRYEGWDRETSSITQTPSGGPQPPGKLADRWEFPRHRLKVFNILGEGCFGQVWRCEAQDIDGTEGTSVVAVKTLKENANEKERSDLVQELQVMKMLEPHPNVVRLLGCCTEKDPLFVIMEFVPHGKLQSFLRSSRAERFYGNLHGPSNTLTSRDLTTFVYQVARGMEFLSAKGVSLTLL
uniref:Protein kinase domain-containing protein n=1 Tax=Timema monikensis TaxID=170555 RepID=A0A7R9E836_9NEOP|nr:unnamed protein product [Timema monikensis]